MVTSRSRRRAAGATLMEVLVTIVVISFGLLGLAGLQMRIQTADIEAYQRSQALLLVQDMASRLAANRLSAASYVTGATFGEGMTCPTDNATTVQRDLRDWCLALQGAAELSGGSRVGAMIGGRGCVELVDGDYMITVAWQGLIPISAPPTSVGCGAGSYNSGSTCVNDLCRRAVTTLVRLATLL